MSKTLLYTGAKGFIAGYTIQKFLDEGYEVVGIDNNWKYGNITKSYDNHSNYEFKEGDAKDPKFLEAMLDIYKPDVFLLGAALIGGISFFHSFPYDIISQNEQITANSFDCAIKAFKKGYLKKVVVLSSSMVFEKATVFPTPEGHQQFCFPPMSSYGFQKLATEYFAEAAHKQYGLPYVILRPFNCAGIGEYRAKVDKEILSGNITLAMSHVIIDLIQKIEKNQFPLRILGSGMQVRHYTYGGDLAEGIYKATESEFCNTDFNLSTPIGHTVLELAEYIWSKMDGSKRLQILHDPPFEYDVQLRVPDTDKARRVLGFEANTSLDKILDETIPWVRDAIKKGLI